MRMFGYRRWIMCVLGLACCGCTAIVDPEPLLVRCSVQNGKDPCTELGLVCVSGMCQACVSQTEVCDGKDNDCDGKVDEGPDSNGNGKPAIELCNNVDDDCDGNVDEG